MTLPTGTVTFLFTDIEGSTKLWEKHSEAMHLALARHDALLRAVIMQHGGHVFKTMGDAFCATFHTASHALSAALAAQQALNAEVWPEPVTIKVRMAIHTGAAEVRDNDYFGQPLNRVARLLSVGHGGQVLLSDVAHNLCRDSLPLSASLLNLGEHRLRDLSRPEVVFQLVHSGLPSEFPPLKSLDNPHMPNNLPQQVTSFIGREKEIAEVTTLLAKSPLLTLTGSGGCGKTRLSLQVAVEVLEQFPEGVWLVELAALADASLVVQTVAQVLGLKEQAGQTILHTLTETLKTKRLLLVLDNCEHLIAACAQLVSVLLRVCPSVTVLATSREPMGVSGEQTYRVPSLAVPDLRQPSSPQSVSQFEAVRLFIERTMLVKPGFVVTNHNAPALAQVCSRLDGIPLAIELAAARVRSMPVEDINARLDNRFRLLTGGDRSALPRQQTLRALIDWSYDLLNAQEKTLLQRLSVFAGGGTLQAVEQVCSGEGLAGEKIEDWEALDLLTSLVDKSLVISEEEDSTARYRMLETVRQYATERLHASGETAQVKTRHRGYFVSVAEGAALQLYGPEQPRWLEHLETEHDNLRAALAWCEAEEEAEAGLRLSGALSRFWDVRCHWSEGREYLERALERGEVQAATMARAKAQNGAGVLALCQGDLTAARTQLEQGLRLFRDLGDKSGIAWSLNSLGTLVYYQGDLTAARTQLEESLSLFRELGDNWGVATALIELGSAASSQGDYAAARTQLEEGLRLNRELGNKSGIAHVLGALSHIASNQGDYAGTQVLCEESLSLFKELGNESGIAWSLFSLGNVASNQGNLAAARTRYEESLSLFRELGEKWGIPWALNGLGSIALAQGDYTAARTQLEESLRLLIELGIKSGIAYVLHNLGCVALAQDDYAAARTQLEESLRLNRDLGNKSGIANSLEKLAETLAARADCSQSTRLWGAADLLRESISAPRPLHEQENCDQQIAQARTALGNAAFNAAWEEGRAMSWEQAVAYMLGEARE